MKDFISVSLMTHSKDYISQVESHNINREDIDYLLDEEDRLGNYSESFSPVEDVVQIVNVSAGTYAENLRNFYANYQASSRTLKDNLDFLESVRKSQQKEKGFKDKQKKHLIEFSVNLSEEKTKEYLKNGVDIKAGFQQYVKDLKKMGIHTLQLDFHTDEGSYKNNALHYNFHAHIVAYNYNFETKKAIASNFRKKDYRKLQTLAQNSFKAVGLDYKRGYSKFITNKVHLRRDEYIYEQKKKEKNLLFKEITTLQKDLLELKSKVELEEINVQDYQKWNEEIKSGLKDFIKSHTIKNDNKYQIKSIKSFYDELVDLVDYVSNFDIKLEELEKVSSTNQILKAKIESLTKEKEQFLKALEKLKLYESKIKSLIDKKDTLEDENYQLMQYLKDKELEDDFKSFISNLKKYNLNDIGR